jgi:hypothetical protein
MVKRILFLAFVLVLEGCAGTAYQSSAYSYTGGYDQVSGYGRLEKIMFFGNGYTDAKKAQQYALYRCAEVAKDKKKPYFMMYENLTAASLGKSTGLPAVSSVDNKPTAYSFVLLLDEARPGALETEKTLSELSSLVKESQINNSPI